MKPTREVQPGDRFVLIEEVSASPQWTADGKEVVIFAKGSVIEAADPPLFMWQGEAVGIYMADVRLKGGYAPLFFSSFERLAGATRCTCDIRFGCRCDAGRAELEHERGMSNEHR